MRWPFRKARRSDPWGDVPISVTCVRVVIDARVTRYLQHHAAQVPSDGGAPRVREAAVVLRKVRSAWFAIGVEARDSIAPRDARAQLACWRHQMRSSPDGDAIVATLVAASRRPLILPRVSTTVDDARAALEALSAEMEADVLELELVTDGRPVDSHEAIRTLVDPPLVETGILRSHQQLCVGCGTWLPEELERCSECAPPAGEPARFRAEPDHAR